jgi:hypothetical protein
LAEHLTAVSETAMAQLRAGMLDQHKANAILRGELQRLRQKFAAQSALDVPAGVRTKEAREDRLAAEAFALAATRGPTFALTTDDRIRLRAAGLTETDIERVLPVLSAYRDAGLVPTPPGKAERIASAYGVEPTPANLAQTSALHLHAVAPALREQADITESGFTNGQRQVEIVAAAPAPAVSSVTLPPPHEVAPHPPTIHLLPQAPLTPAAPVTPTGSASAGLRHFAEKLTAEKRKHKRWDQKSGTPAMQTYSLFLKSLGHDEPTRIMQADVAGFKDLLGDLPKSYGKSSRDKHLTLAELRAKGATLPPEKRGLGTDAINRHLNFLKQLFNSVRAHVVKLAPELDPSVLRVQEKIDPMDEGAPWSREHRVALYRQPPFTGCRAWNDRTTPGPLAPQVKKAYGQVNLANLLRYLPEHDGLTDDQVGMIQRCHGGTVVDNLIGVRSPKLS